MKRIFIGIMIGLVAITAGSYYFLKNAPEQNQHNMRGANNKVFLHKDGHSEAIYDQNNKLVEECMNMASYNYANRFENPFLHFYQDTLPWIIYGNCKDDPTSRDERLEAFYRDLWLGVKITFRASTE